MKIKRTMDIQGVLKSQAPKKLDLNNNLQCIDF